MTEGKRGCGYRKKGGIYLMGGNLDAPCCRFPIPLGACPCCGEGVKQTRGWTWVRPALLIGKKSGAACGACPMTDPANFADEHGRAGLLWVGESFYPTPAAFTSEAARMGISRRVKAPPRGAEPGKTWILLAHPKAVTTQVAHLSDEERDEAERTHKIAPGQTFGTIMRPGIFAAFRLSAIEKCVSAKEAEDVEAMDALRKRNITPVILEDHPRHEGNVHERDEEAEEQVRGLIPLFQNLPVL